MIFNMDIQLCYYNVFLYERYTFALIPSETIALASRDATTLNFKIPRNECVHIERAQFLPGQPIRTEMEGHIGDPNPTDLLDHVRRAYSGDGNLKAHTEIDKCFVPSLFVEGRRINCPQGK